MGSRRSERTPPADWPGRIFPVLMESRVQPSLRRGSLATTEFLTGFQVGYVLRLEEKPIPVTKGLFGGMKVTLENLHKAAIANLAKDSAGATFKFFDSPDGGVLLFESEGGLHSSRLLLPNLYKWLHKFMGGPFIAAVPNRDVLIAVAESNRTALAGLPDDIDLSYTGRRFPLTKSMFRVTAGGIALLS